MNPYIVGIGKLRSELSLQYESNMTREVALVITKLDEAMLWAGVQDLSEQETTSETLAE